MPLLEVDIITRVLAAANEVWQWMGFTIIAIVMLVSASVHASNMNWSDHRKVVDVSDDIMRQSTLHSRQDIRFIAYLLGAILVMLGIIADGLHRGQAKPVPASSSSAAPRV